MTLEVEQAGRQGLTTQAPQSSESYSMSKEGSNLEAEVRGIGARMEGLEKRQEEIVKLLNSLKWLKRVLQCTETNFAGLS